MTKIHIEIGTPCEEVCLIYSYWIKLNQYFTHFKDYTCREFELKDSFDFRGLLSLYGLLVTHFR